MVRGNGANEDRLTRSERGTAQAEKCAQGFWHLTNEFVQQLVRDGVPGPADRTPDAQEDKGSDLPIP